MVLLHSAAGNTSEETLLHAAPEADNGDLGRRLCEERRVRLRIDRSLRAEPAYQFDVDGDLTRTNPGENDPGSHAHDIPEILLTNEVLAIERPGAGGRVIDVTHDRECPCEKFQFSTTSV